MKFIIEREVLLKPLQQLCGLLVSRPLSPILENLLLKVSKDVLLLSATNLEVDMVSQVVLMNKNIIPGSTTIPARKFFEIFRNLQEGSEVSVTLKDDRVLVCSGNSRFSLFAFSAADFPVFDSGESELELSISQITLKRLIESTQFSMAYQDARHYLNGMLFETEEKVLRTVTTDGHRLAICSMFVSKNLDSYSVIIPRKSINELARLLKGSEDLLKIEISSNNIRICFSNFIFTSKLIDGVFPDYRHVLVKNPTKTLEVSCEVLRQACVRVAVLSNEKFRAVHFFITKNHLKITTKNFNQEEAEEIIEIISDIQKLEISFNVNYLLDVLNVLKCEKVCFLFIDAFSSVQIEDVNKNQSEKYVLMPMRF